MRFSQENFVRAAQRLLRSATDGVGYLLKDRIADMEELTAAIRAVASGGSAIDPEVLTRLEQPALSAPQA